MKELAEDGDGIITADEVPIIRLVCSQWACIFDNMALYFECQINKTTLLQTVFFGDFSH